jgi:FkbM family methyltransferase
MLEAIHNITITGINSRNAPRRFVSKILLKFIRKLAVVYDPLVNYQLKNHQIKLPISHSLPLVIQEYPDYADNLARIASCIYSKYPALTIIDIGANIGDSVFVLRQHVLCPILCIEGDPRFFEVLQTNTAKTLQVSSQNVFIGDADQESNQELVVVLGTAHFQSSSSQTTVFKKLSTVLQKETDFTDSKLVKIDTDGFDLAIIRGSADFIRSAKPVIFFEYDPFFLSKQNDDGISIFALLQTWGYHSIAIYDNFGRYLISLKLTDCHQIADLHQYLLDRQGTYYYDICAIHTEDIEILDQIRKIELTKTA